MNVTHLGGGDAKNACIINLFKLPKKKNWSLFIKTKVTHVPVAIYVLTEVPNEENAGILT